MTVMLRVARDSGALALGAEAVARALEEAVARSPDPVRIVRTGSRGLYWLEPIVEVLTPTGPVAYGPVTAADVPALLAAGLLRGGEHPLRIGDVERHPWLATQQRVTACRLGRIDPLSLDDYVGSGGFRGLQRALGMSAGEIVAEVTASELRGRGGAGFPTGVKWSTVLAQRSGQKYVACNADEGDSGTFADRMLMEGDPFSVIEGMIIAGLAVGADRGFVYLRVEYPHAARTFRAALEAARAAGYLGADVGGSGRTFDVELRLGAGAYICGEETSMLESLEGRRGEVRVRPPMPAVRGLFDCPTAVNNVVTLATVPLILAEGAEQYRGLGTGRSRGTALLQLAGNVRRGGLVERAFGLSLNELIYDYGGGSASGRPIRAVQIGGPLGAYLPASDFDVPLDYESLVARGAMLGHGGVVVFDDSADMAAMARQAFEFCAAESCGKCTPCRIGSSRGVELVDALVSGRERARNLARLHELCDTLYDASLCGLGGMIPNPVRSALQHFGGDFDPSLRS